MGSGAQYFVDFIAGILGFYFFVLVVLVAVAIATGKDLEGFEKAEREDKTRASWRGSYRDGIGTTSAVGVLICVFLVILAMSSAISEHDDWGNSAVWTAVAICSFGGTGVCARWFLWAIGVIRVRKGFRGHDDWDGE